MLSTSRRSGTLTKAVTVYSNDPKKPRLTLKLQGIVKVDIETKPRYVSFNNLGKNEKSTRELTLTVTEPEKVKITDVKIEDPRFVLKKKSNEPANTHVYEIEFKGSDKIERVSSAVKINYEGSEATELSIPIRANIVGNLRYSKNLYFLKRDGKFRPRDIIITTRTGKPVKIKKIEDKENLLKTEITERVGARVSIRAEVANPEKVTAKPTPHKLLVHTSDKDEPVVEIKYTISESRRPERRALRKPSMVRTQKKSEPKKVEKNKAKSEANR